MKHGRSTALIAFFGIAGLLVSWGLFATFFIEHGPDMVTFWTQALWGAGGLSGLTWDLVFSAFIVTTIAIRDREELGSKGMAGVIATTAILGVCGGLALYIVLKNKA